MRMRSFGATGFDGSWPARAAVERARTVAALAVAPARRRNWRRDAERDVDMTTSCGRERLSSGPPSVNARCTLVRIGGHVRLLRHRRPAFAIAAALLATPCGVRRAIRGPEPARGPEAGRRLHRLGRITAGPCDLRRGRAVTARPPELREATERNLREQGYDWDAVVLPPAGASTGDQQSDLDGGFAERTFRLPNAVYFLP